MPKIVDENERKNAIADAAVQVFANHGFSETTVQEIADEADISKGSIYLYFDSKSGILSHVFHTFQDDLHDAFDEILSSDRKAGQKLEILIENLTVLVELNRPTIKVLFDFWSHSLHSNGQSKIDFQAFYGRIRDKIRNLLQDGIENGIFRSDLPNNLPSILIGFFEGQLIQWLVDPTSPPLDEIAESGFEMFMNGLKS